MSLIDSSMMDKLPGYEPTGNLMAWGRNHSQEKWVSRSVVYRNGRMEGKLSAENAGNGILRAEHKKGEQTCVCSLNAYRSKIASIGE